MGAFTTFEFTENLSQTGWLAAGTIPAFTLSAEIEEGPGFNITLPALTSEATALTGEAATVAQTLPAPTLEATAQQEPYANITMPALSDWTLDIWVTAGTVVAARLPMPESSITVIAGGITTLAETLTAFTIEAASGADTRLEVPPLSLAATLAPGRNATAALTLPLPTIEATASASLNPGAAMSAGLFLPLPTIEATAVQTEIYSVDVTLPAAVSLSAQVESGAVTTISVSLPVHTLSSTGLSGTVSTLLEALPALEAEASMLWAGTATVDQTLPAIQALAAAIQVTTDALGTPQAWVLNLRNLGLTEYTNWAFNSMTYFNGKYIGASEAGVIELGVQDHEDDTTDIPARFRTGKHDMDSSFLKRVPHGYLECEADGDVLVSTLTSEDGQRDYLVPWNGNDEVQNRRVNFGRGPKSKHWQFEFANREGSHFRVVALDSLPRRSHRRVQ